MKIMKLFVLIFLVSAMMPLSAQNSAGSEDLSSSYDELKNICDVIASGKLTRQQSERLLQGFLREDERAEVGAELIVGEILLVAGLFASIIGCYYSCCKGAASCSECCKRCGICCDECNKVVEDARRNNDGNYLA